MSGRKGWFADPGGPRRVQWKALINPSVEPWIGDCNYFWLFPLRFSPLYFYARMCTSKRRFNSCPNFPHSKFWKNCLCFNCFIYNMYENRYTSCSACAQFYKCRGFMNSINPETSILFPLTVERLNHSLRWLRIKEMIINLRRFVILILLTSTKRIVWRISILIYREYGDWCQGIKGWRISKNVDSYFILRQNFYSAGFSFRGVTLCTSQRATRPSHARTITPPVKPS